MQIPSISAETRGSGQYGLEESAALPNQDTVCAYVQAIVERASAIRLPELFGRNCPEALYMMADREGVAVIALRTTSLGERELKALLTYRLAQYLLAGFVDPQMAYTSLLEHEPLVHVAPNDVHIVAVNAHTGEILCYLVIESMGNRIPADASLRERYRPLIGLEEVYGFGIFNRLRLLPDLPLGRVREIGRFVKNQRLPYRNELLIRAPIEVLVAVSHLLTGALCREVDAIVGLAEEDVVLENLAYFQLPVAVIRGTVACAEEGAFVGGAHLHGNHYPIAFLVSDVKATLPRVTAIEQALELPGKQSTIQLLRLKRDAGKPHSTLEPANGLPLLDRVFLPERRAPMHVRRRLLDLGEWLRQIDLFCDLSVGEATVLGTLLERLEIRAGWKIAATGNPSDGLYLIESGVAEIRSHSGTSQAAILAELGPGAYFGPAGRLSEALVPIDVVAKTPLRLLRLSPEVIEQYLAPLPDVCLQLSRVSIDWAGLCVRACSGQELTPLGKHSAQVNIGPCVPRNVTS